MLEQILAGLLPALWDGSFWQLSHYEIDRRELVLKFAPYRLSKQMIVKVGLRVRFNIHNLTNQRYFVAANAAGAFSTEPPPAVWAGLPGSRCGDAATHARATNLARPGLAG